MRRFGEIACRVVLMATVLMAATWDGFALTDTAKAKIEDDWARQEMLANRLLGTEASVDALLTCGQRLMQDPVYPKDAPAYVACRRVLAEVSALTDWKTNRVTTAGEAAYRRARWAIRDLAFANPLLDFEALVFVQRKWPTYNHQCVHRVGEAQVPGANLCLLTGLSPDGQVRGLLPDSLAATSGMGRPDLSFDGKKIVFPLALQRRSGANTYRFGLHTFYDPAQPTDSTPYRGGKCEMYDLYEINTDGTGLRRLTTDDQAEDTEPCYLPDGRIVFTSSRGNRMVQCGDWALVFGLFTMNADGSRQVAITEPQDSEFYPSMLDDGRILYTRWDYVMKSYNVVQQLWAVNPNGTRAQLAYGDWYAFSRGPLALFEARQIPGTRKVVAVGAAHHNVGVGPLMVVDLNQNRGGPSGMVNITPEMGYPEVDDRVKDERVDKSAPDYYGTGIKPNQNRTGWYASPWPLSERHFLVCYSLEESCDVKNAYGLYLYDVHGSKELIYRFPGSSCYSPIPLKPRPLPLVMTAEPPSGDRHAPARLFVQDVGKGLDGVPAGTVKWLRVYETFPKRRHTNPHRVDVGVSSGYDMRSVMGLVPVEADGSAYFTVPAGRMIFLSALDKDFLEVRRMRNYVNLMPGEVQSCVGCHESPREAAKAEVSHSLAMKKGPATIQPPDWGGGPMSFRTVVQPVLDRHCVRCHQGGSGAGKAFDLRGKVVVKAPAPGGDGDEGPQHGVTDSFLALLKHVKYCDRIGGYGGEKLPLAPYAVGSAVSPLMRMLKRGHQGVTLPKADWEALASWIDCNAPFYGSYDEALIFAGK